MGRSAGGEEPPEPSTDAPAPLPAASRSNPPPRARVGVASLGVVAAAAFALAAVRRSSRARSTSAPETPPSTSIAMPEPSSPREEARRHREAGNAHYHRREYAVAIACYDRSVALDPSAHATYTNRAAARLARGDASGALDDADAALARHPGWVKGHYRRGACLMALERYDEATRAYRAGLEVDPTNAQLKTALGRAAALLAAQPADPLDAKTRGNEAFREGKFEDAVAWYGKGLRLCDASSPNPNPKVAATLLSNRAEARRQMTEMDACLADCDAALAIDAGNVKATLRRALALEFLERRKDAADAFRATLALDPKCVAASEGARRIAAFRNVE